MQSKWKYDVYIMFVQFKYANEHLLSPYYYWNFDKVALGEGEEGQ